MSSDLTNEQRFFADVAQILQAGRSQAYRAINTEMVHTYWHLGQRIVEEEQQGQTRAEYGQALIRKLSRYLGEHFGQGFSVANLKNFRQFYLTFPSLEEIATHCVAKLHYSVLRESQQLFASKYQMLLPTETELAAMLAHESTKQMEAVENKSIGGEA